MQKLLSNKNLIKKISCILLIISFSLVYYKNNITTQAFQLEYELINTKDMAMVEVSEKQEAKELQTKDVFQIYKEMKSGTYVSKESPTPVALPAKKNTVATLESPKRIWYLPTEYGTITSYPSASHFALDITSPRGTSEPIYPIANGIISGIYRDSAGAKIITVNHNINGQNYTSQYVHLSSYAPDLYVGKPVTINDYLGFMGRTGIATGVHLHIAVVDCSIFDNNDSNCSSLNGFFRYGRERYYQGFMGLQSLINVPTTWYSR
ncbi:MAG: M23 family metallopeptidase [bacterium]|nr:M23 family metallopeptidase [bacterium]